MVFLSDEMRAILLSLLVWLAILCGPSLVASTLLADLDAKQVEEVARGGQVLLLQDIDGHPWPRVLVYQKVNATPEEVAGVFFDYKNAKAYVPKVIKSEIVREVTPCVVEVDYGIDVPLLPDEYYTARNSLTAGEDGGFVVCWNLVKALQTKASEGNLKIERWNGGSVIRYTNLVTPSSGMAGLLKAPAIDQMRDTVRAIVARVEKQKAAYPEELKAEVKSLRDALKKESAR